MVLREVLTTAAATVLFLSSCAEDEGVERRGETGGADGEAGGADGEAAPKTSLRVNIEGSDIQASAREVEVPAAAPICLNVESDRRGELHVHSTPDQTLTFRAGIATSCFTIDTPWLLAEVEDHESGQSVVNIVTIAE
jgi:hypothetical protein